MNSQRPFDRIDKVNSLLLREINALLQRENFEQRGSQGNIVLSITKIDASRDLKHAKVFFSVMPLKFRGEAKKFLDSKASLWQKSVGEKITLKYIPRLRFSYDEGQKNAMEVEEILAKTKSNR